MSESSLDALTCMPYDRPRQVYTGQTISLLKQMKGCYGLILCDGHDRGLAGLEDQLAVAMKGQTLAPDPLTAVQTVLPISANI